MKHILLLAAVVFLLSGCNENRDRTTGVADYEIKADGCTVKYIDNPRGYNFFIAKCPAASETTTYMRPQGKSSVPTATVMTSDDLRKQLAEVEAKEKALAKLSVQEKVLLGIKE
jgi:uncharacterized lipoprotein YajG